MKLLLNPVILDLNWKYQHVLQCILSFKKKKSVFPSVY